MPLMPPYVLNHEVVPGEDLIHYSGPYWDEKEVNAAVWALTQGKWLGSGVEVQRFEREFSKQFGHKESLMVNSGSSANLVMLASIKKYLRWDDDAEVIVSPVGFPTTIAPIIQNKMVPVFADIEWETLNFDLNEVEKKITEKTRAIFLSPVLGNPPSMKRLWEIVESNRIELILDGCDSLGSKYSGSPLHVYALASSCSFYPAHHITTGEGGMVSSNNEEIVRLARKFAWWGRDCYCVGQANFLKGGTCGRRFDAHLGLDVGVCDHKYVFSELGYNLKPLDLQGAIGSVQLKKFPEIHEKRRMIKKRLHGAIASLNGPFRVIDELAQSETSWFGVPIVCETQEVKTKLVGFLEDKKIQTRNYFAGNILLHPGYKHLGNAFEYGHANQVLKRVFFIGCYPGYSEEVLRYIESCFREFKEST